MLTRAGLRLGHRSKCLIAHVIVALAATACGKSPVGAGESAPTVSLSATPASVASGGSATLTWSSTNVTSCTASGGWSGGRALFGGPESTGPLATSASYALDCSGPRGSASASATVNVSPTVSISANPTSVASGGSSMLTWSSTNATSCVASGAWSGAVAISGNQSVGPLTASSTYSLTCTGAGGSTSASATVAVSGAPPPPPAPTVSLTANPSSVASGGSSMLTWSSTNATSCAASGAWSGSKALSNSTGESTGALTTTSTFTLACTGAGGSASGSATVTVTGTGPVYSTVFNSTENPISEGGAWIDGKEVGLDWNNPRTLPGQAFASTLSGLLAGSDPLRRYDDSIAHLSTSVATFASNQYAQGTVYKAAGYTTSGSHEVELLLRFQTTAHNARGYEILWGISGYVAIVRWNGPLGNYTPLYDPGVGSISVPADGDVLRAEIIGSTISVYKNGNLVKSVTDTTYASGQPGMGFWPVDGATPQNLGWKSFQAGNLP